MLFREQIYAAKHGQNCLAATQCLDSLPPTVKQFAINIPFFQLCITLVQDGKKSRLFMCSKLVGPNVNYSPFVSICKYVLTVALQITFHVTQSNSVILK